MTEGDIDVLTERVSHIGTDVDKHDNDISSMKQRQAKDDVKINHMQEEIKICKADQKLMMGTLSKIDRNVANTNTAIRGIASSLKTHIEDPITHPKNTNNGKKNGNHKVEPSGKMERFWAITIERGSAVAILVAGVLMGAFMLHQWGVF